MDEDEQFKEAVACLRSSEYSEYSEHILLLYGLYKRVTQGVCNQPEPWHCQIEAHARWKAWMDTSSMSRSDAIQKYVDYVQQIYKTLK